VFREHRTIGTAIPRALMDLRQWNSSQHRPKENYPR
jgi:hypothetical protein